MTDLVKLLGTRVREIREKRGWSQDVLAELSGLNRFCIGALERAEHNVGIRNIALVANALEVPVDQLFVTPCVTGDLTDTLAKESSPPLALINKAIFFELLSRCASDRPDLIAIYLERCGVVFAQNIN